MALAGDRQRRTFGPAGLRRRAELMQAAVELATQHGFSRTRVSDIVGRVGVGQGVFYWYFESKDALFREILADTARRMRLFQGAFIAGETDPLRRIAKGILATLDFISRNGYLFAFLDHASVEARRQQQRTEARRVHDVDTARHIQEGIELEIMRPGDPVYLAVAIGGVVDRMARAFFASKDCQIDRVAQEAIDFCAGGLCYPSGLRVEDLRREVELGSEVLELRDTIGAGTTDAPER